MAENIKDSFDISDSELDNVLAGIPEADTESEDLEVEEEMVDELFDTSNDDSDEDTGEDNPESEQEPEENNPFSAEDSDEITEDNVEDIEPEFYKETFDKIFAPFKASGKEIQVKSADEVIKLMQMGADYYNKTQKHAKDIKLAAVLKNNGLDDSEKLNFLIDVMNGEKGAIKKLLKDVNYEYDSYDDEDSAEDYKPRNHSVSDAEITMRSILSEGKNDPAFQNMLKEVTEWDTDSRAAFSSHPEILNILADNYRSGAYQKVMDEIDRQRMFGNLIGLSTLQAYRQVVSDLADSEQLNTRNSQSAPQPSKATSSVQDKRKALSPSPRGKVSNASKIDNLYDLSDEEIMKLAL